MNSLLRLRGEELAWVSWRSHHWQDEFRSTAFPVHSEQSATVTCAFAARIGLGHHPFVDLGLDGEADPVTGPEGVVGRLFDDRCLERFAGLDRPCPTETLAVARIEEPARHGYERRGVGPHVDDGGGERDPPALDA